MSKGKEFDENMILRAYELSEFIAKAQRWMDRLDCKSLAVLALDINYFKLYNDIYGWEAGNRLIKRTAFVFQKYADTFGGITGYLGGDNFCLAIPFDGLDQRRMNRLIKEEFALAEIPEGFAPAIGICITEERGLSFQTLYDWSLTALDPIKGDYTKHIAYYDKEKHNRMIWEQKMLIDAKKGIEEGEFTFFLQPKLALDSEKIVSCEALVRWYKDGALIPPDVFVPLLEKSGYIVALDKFVWEEVIRWLRDLIDRGITPLPVSINVSQIDFYFTDVAAYIQELSEKYRVDPRFIEVEITESAFFSALDIIASEIDTLRARHFKVSMDDFGQGYSSLGFLRAINIDMLKIDKRFVDLYEEQRGSSIIDSIIGMSHTLDLPIVAEGMENSKQRETLIRLGCDYVQGYYYYRPMPKEDFEKILLQPERLERNGNYPKIRKGQSMNGMNLRRATMKPVGLPEGMELSMPIAVLRSEKKEHRKVMDYTFLSANAAYARAMGVDQHRFKGNSYLKVIPGADREWFDILDQVLLTGEGQSGERFCKEMGRHVHFYAGSVNLSDAVFLALYDVSREEGAGDHMRVQEAIYESLARYVGHSSVYDMICNTGAIRINLTDNKLVDLADAGFPGVKTGYEKEYAYDYMIDVFSREYVPPEYRDRLAAFVNRNRLLDLFQSGTTWTDLEIPLIFQGRRQMHQISANLGRRDGKVMMLVIAINIDKFRSQYPQKQEK